METLNKLCFKK